MTAPRRITLLTDFGTADGYVAAMKGVIAALAPGTLIDDAAHDLPAGDVAAAAWALAAYWDRYPAGTIHVGVVDPGVGTERRPLAVEADGRFLIAPDNGILTRVYDAAAATRIVVIEHARFLAGRVSATFHGRDLFAPVAAHLAGGAELDALGRIIDDPIRLSIPRPHRAGATIRGEIVHVDRFGNLVTNVPADWLSDAARVRIARREIPLRRTYGDVPTGEVVAMVGSRDVLEISVRDGDARRALDSPRGTAVEVFVGG